jgi:hypothetical protein
MPRFADLSFGASSARHRHVLAMPERAVLRRACSRRPIAASS